MKEQVVRTRFLELLSRKARQAGKKSITRREVSEATGISMTSVQNWAVNNLQRYDAHQILAFCIYFDCSVGDLLVIEEVETSGQTEPLLATA